MECLFEILFELIVGGSLDGAADSEWPKAVRIGLLIFATLVYVAITAFFVWLFLTSGPVVVKVVSAGVVLLFVGGFAALWRKVMKAKK